MYECILCDIALQYFLENGKCVVKTKENCLLLNTDLNTCLVCQKGFMWNAEISKCQDIPESRKIANCFGYDHDLNCINCDQDFYFNSSTGKCLAVTTKIKGCLIYEDATNCSYCDVGYMISKPKDTSQTTTCLLEGGKVPTADEGSDATPTVPSPVPCKIRSYFECDKCDSNYFLDFNYKHKLNYKIEKNYLDLLASDLKSRIGIFKGSILTSAMSSTLKTEYNSSPFDLGVYSPCIKGLIDNCAEFETFDNCKTCNENYYRISDGSCVPQPAAPISHCALYETETKCQLCNNGYYLGAGGLTCVEVDSIDNCSKYEGVSNKCAECNSKTLFVNTATNNCDTRQNGDIGNCSKFAATVDNCETCDSGYLLSNDKLKCMKIPTYCFTYIEESAAVKCTGCSPGYYLSTNECIKGSVGSCEDYDQTQANKCVSCDFKFFINSSGTCTNFSKAIDSDCVGTGKKDNECTQCKNNKFAVVRPKRCAQVSSTTTAVGCANFDVNGDCIECNDHYFGTSCQFKNTDTSIGCNKFSNNSDTVTDSHCVFCNRESHYINENKCHSRHNLALKNCKISQLDENECNLCNSESAPRHAKKTVTCNKTSDLNLAADIVSNCEIYDVDTEKCQVCKSGFYLDGTNGCVTTCPSGKIKVEGVYEEIDKETLYFGNQCVSNPYYFDNCDQIKVQPPKNLICTQCKTGFQLSYDVFLGIGYSGTTTVHNYDIGASQFDPRNSFTSFGCVDQTLTKGKKADNSDMFALENCEIFSVNNNILYCSRCVFGKVGLIVKDSVGNKSVSQCVSQSTFDATTKYKSISYALSTKANPPISHGLDSIFSVHKCTTDGEIVFAVTKLKTTSTSSKLVFDITDINNKPAISTNTSSTNFYNICKPKTLLQSGDADLANCILGVMDMENSTDNRFFCVACAPGYKAEKFDVNEVYIKKCSAISNCTAGTTYANVCETCSTGSYTYSQNTSQVLFDQCATTGIANCLLSDSLNASLCSTCNKGYFLSLDKTKCMNQTEENCLVKGSDFLFGIDPALFPNTFPRTLTYINENLGKKRGCEECQNGFIKMAYSKYLCEANVNLIEHTLSDCVKPTIDSGNLTCIECKTGFIPQYNSKSCIKESIDSTYVNCDLLDSTPITRKTAEGGFIYPCKICNSQYIYSTRLTCDIKIIANCDEHDTTTGKCNKCKENFLLSFEECVAIPSDELCVKFDNKKNCIQCKSGYELVIVDDGDSNSNNNEISLKSECIVTGYNHHCVSGKNRIFYDPNTEMYKEECTECLSGYTLVEKDGTEYGDDYSKCYPVPYKDDNCQEYNKASLMCKICKTGYFMSTQNQINVCKQIVPVDNCTAYLENTNTCTTCQNGYFLKLDTRECMENPKGIQNCLKYETNETCETCQNNYYLSNNACVEVPTDNQISNCSEYKSATECQKCDGSNVPNKTGSACETITENSCLTWEDGSNCATCSNTKTLKDQGGKKVCGDFSIANCAIVNAKDAKCTLCSPDHYPSGSATCTAATTSISNCLVHESADKCGECESTYMLNVEKTECVGLGSLSGIPLSNCSTGHELAPLVDGETDPGYCHECNSGFLKVNGKCEACGVSKCRYCDPSNKSECMVCLNGYFMSEEGKCMSNTGDDEVVTPPETEDESVSIYSIFTLWIIFVSLLIHN